MFYLTDRPADAKWLARDERAWLAGRLELEDGQREAVRHYSVLRAMVNPRVLALSLVYSGSGHDELRLEFLPAADRQVLWTEQLPHYPGFGRPLCGGTIGMIWWGLHSDRKIERRLHAAFPLFIAAAGIAVSTALGDPVLKMIALSIAGFGIFARPSDVLDATDCFSFGCECRGRHRRHQLDRQSRGLCGPFAMGWIKDQTGSYTGGLLLAALGIVAMGIVLTLGHHDVLERTSTQAGQ